MSTFTHTQKRFSAKDEPEDLRQLRADHGGSLATLKELFADWTDEDLLYAIQESNGDLELAILRISEGHATQWGEVKGKKKTPKPKTFAEKQDSRTISQRGGFADRGGRGRSDGARGGRGGARGTARPQNGRPAKTENGTASPAEPTPVAIKAEQPSGPSWADITTGKAAEKEKEAVATAAAAAAAATAASTTVDAWNEPVVPSSTSSTKESTDAPASSDTTSSDTTTTTTSNEVTTPASAPTSASAPARKVNTSTIPAGSKMSWAKIVKPEPAPAPIPAPTPAAAAAPAPTTATTDIPASTPAQTEPILEEPAPESTPEPVVEEPKIEEAAQHVEDKEEEVKAEESVVEESQPEEPAVEHVVEKKADEAAAPAAASPAPASKAPVGPPGLKSKPVSQVRRLNQDAPVVMPTKTAALERVGVQFGSFSLKDKGDELLTPTDTEPEQQPAAAQPVQSGQPVQPAVNTPSAVSATANQASTPAALPQPQQQQQQPAQQSQQLQQPQPQPQPQPQQQQPQPAQQSQQPQQPQQQPQQPQQQQQQGYGRQPSIPSGASGYQGATPVTSGQSPAASYLKQDPSATYGQHHPVPGMGHEAMGSPYSYLHNPSQLGGFNMAPMGSLPNEYAALYGNDIQRAMYYDPATYGQFPAGNTNYGQSRDGKFNQDSSSTVSTTGASHSATTSQAGQQTLQQQQTQQQQQQQQAYPNLGGMPYYPYYYMAPNQFPNAYQQSGYGQPFKNMYPMYQHTQQHSNKPGAGTSSPYGTYSSTGGQGHHQYGQSGYDDMSAGGFNGMQGMGLGNDPYGNKYGNPGMQNFLGSQQQPVTPNANANNAKAGSNSGNYASSGDKNASTGSQPSSGSQMAGGNALQGQQPGGGMNQGNQQGYYQQQMFSSYQYPSHHQGYHPNQHQGQHGSGRNQQYWSQN